MAHFSGVSTGDAFPPTFRAKLRWSASVTTPASSTTSFFNVYGNSPYQPCTALSSGSANNHRILAGLYGLTRVYSSKCTVRCGLQSTSVTPTAVGMGMDMCLFPCVDAVTSSSLLTAMQQPKAKFRVAQTGVCTVSSRMTTKYMLAKDPSVEDVLSAGTSSHPGYPWYWVLAVGSNANYTNVVIVIDIVVEYDVMYYLRGYTETATFDRMDQKQLEEYNSKIKNAVMQRYESKEVSPDTGVDYARFSQTLRDLHSGRRGIPSPGEERVFKQLLASAQGESKSFIKSLSKDSKTRPGPIEPEPNTDAAAERKQEIDMKVAQFEALSKKYGEREGLIKYLETEWRLRRELEYEHRMATEDDSWMD